jgi:Zn-dependent protease
MELPNLIDGFKLYLCFLPLLTFHEFGHAWMAWKCGDDTARLQGRISLNPLVHMDLVGTVILPLLAIFSAGLIIGWGKPVPVNPYNLRNRRLDDTLVSLAGPAMNIALATGLMALAKVGLLLNWMPAVGELVQVAQFSLFLCFFNLLPIPPLDGSHVLKNFIGIGEEAYWRLSQYGFLIVIVAFNFRFVQDLLSKATRFTLSLLAWVFGLNS